MKRTTVIWSTMAGMTLFGAGLVFGQGVNIDPARHPNLADAQHHIAQAMEKIDVAQKENRFDLGGHADKAKEFLVQADRELKEAAMYADHHPR